MKRTMTACGALVLAAGVAGAQQLDWRYPAVESFGPVVPIPGATAERAEPYRVVFDITSASPGDGRVSADLAGVARFVNLLALSGMDPSHSDIVAVLHGAATSAVVSDPAYAARFGTPNPNARLITELENSGVEVIVCGQAVAGAGFPLAAVLDPVEIAISAMTELAARQLDGYAVMP